MTMRLALLGSSGQLGCAVRKLAPADWTILRPGRKEIDLAGPPARLEAWLDSNQPHGIINAAAYNAVEQAETESDQARQLNTAVPRQLAEWAARRNVYLVHFSSDYVFSGDERQPIEPPTPVAPVNAYGRSKAGGELPFLSPATPGALIRTSGVFGHRNPTSRTSNFIEKILARAGLGEPFSVRDDLTFSPTWADDLARCAIRCFHDRTHGVQHCTSEGATTWFEWAREILRQSNLDPDLIVPAQGTPAGQARRPRFTVLACTRNPETAGFTPWKIALQRYLADHHV